MASSSESIQSPLGALLLIVDDEPHIRRALRNVLRPLFQGTIEASSAAEAADLAAARRPDLIILDLGLPDRPGHWVCAEIRKWSQVPILVVSAHHSEAEKIRLLDEGADDYVTKPFSPGELTARVRAHLRRAARDVSGSEVIHAGPLAIDTGARTVRKNGEEVHLTPTEWELMRVLLRHRGKTLTHSQIFSAVWAASGGDPQQYLRVHVANLRRKLEPDTVRPRLIITEPGVGYRFAAEE